MTIADDMMFNSDLKEEIIKLQSKVKILQGQKKKQSAEITKLKRVVWSSKNENVVHLRSQILLDIEKEYLQYASNDSKYKQLGLKITDLKETRQLFHKCERQIIQAHNTLRTLGPKFYELRNYEDFLKKRISSTKNKKIIELFEELLLVTKLIQEKKKK